MGANDLGKNAVATTEWLEFALAAENVKSII